MLSRPILHVLDHALPDCSGYSVRSHNLLRHLGEAGVPLHIVASSMPAGAAAEEVIDRVPYTRVPLRVQSGPQTALSSARRISRLARWLRREIRDRRVGLVHAHSPAINGIAALWAARREGIPTIYEVRALWEDAAVDRGLSIAGSPRYRATRALERWLLRRVDAVATISRGLVAEVAGRGVMPDRIFHTPNAIDCRLFRPMPADTDLAARHRLADATVFGYVGRLFAYEGIDDLVRAFACAREKLPQARLLLVGDGDEDHTLRALVRRLGIDSSVIFAGQVPYASVQRYYSLCDVLVYPRRASRNTDLVTPLKPLEALAMGKPIVASDVGGLRELVRTDETGLLAPPSNPERLAEVLIAIGSDAARRARLGTNARRVVAEQHDWGRVVAVYQDAYRRLLGGPELPCSTMAPQSNQRESA